MAKKARRSSSRGKTVKKPGKARSPKPAPAPKKRSKAASAKQTSASSATGSPAVKASAIDTLVWTHGSLGMLLDGFPVDKATYQTSAGDNHVLWTLGHLATSYAWFITMFDAAKIDLPAGYDKLFGYGSKPVGDASQYPSFAEVKKVHDAAFDRLLAVVKGQSDADLLKAPSSPDGKDVSWFGKNRLEILARIGWHEGWHQGQVSTLRRALGLKSIY